MCTFFTVDRIGSLREGVEINVTRYSDIEPSELQAHVDLMFPDGVSVHGDTYFLKSGADPTATNPAIELLFEYVRRTFFSHRPSRFACAFGVESIESAIRFNDDFGGGQGKIWKVQCAASFRANMALLSNQHSVLSQSHAAHLYWQGEPGDGRVFWEYLLLPPIQVIERIALPDPWRQG